MRWKKFFTYDEIRNKYFKWVSLCHGNHSTYLNYDCCYFTFHFVKTSHFIFFDRILKKGLRMRGLWHFILFQRWQSILSQHFLHSIFQPMVLDDTIPSIFFLKIKWKFFEKWKILCSPQNSLFIFNKTFLSSFGFTFFRT